MTRRILLGMALLATVVVLGVWIRGRDSAVQPPAVSSALPAAPRSDLENSAPTPVPPPLEPSRTQTAEWAAGEIRLAPGAAGLVRDLNDRAQSPRHDLEVLHEILDSYRRIFGENPFGGLNNEITASLTGKNSKNLAVMPPESPGIDDQGRLLDRWGTPYFFHPVSSQIMEVLSAGPDGKLWTEDDVTAQ